MPGLNQSKARALLSSPARFRWECDNPKAQTPDMLEGTLAHVFVLEPDSFADRFVTVPEDAPDKPTSRQINAKKPSEDTLKAIEWWAKFNEAAAGKDVVSRAVSENARAYADGILRTMTAHGIKPIAVEVALTADYHGVGIKGSLDIVGEDGYIYDVKTTKEDATREGFGKAVDRSKELKLQAAWYRYLFAQRTGVYPEGFRWIAQEKEAPYLGAVFEAHPDHLAEGGELMLQVITAFKSCETLGEWPGYPAEVIKLDSWRVNQSTKGSAPLNFA